MLVREGQTDLSRKSSSHQANMTSADPLPAFRAPDLEQARVQWLHELSRRMALLQSARCHSPDELEYGGAAALSHNVNPLEEGVDEARRMVCALSGEMRRRSDGELPKWLDPVPNIAVVGRTNSAGV